MRGTLVSVDQYLNLKLNNITVDAGVQYPQLGALKNCFIRGSVIRYVQFNLYLYDLPICLNGW